MARRRRQRERGDDRERHDRHRRVLDRQQCDGQPGRVLEGAEASPRPPTSGRAATPPSRFAASSSRRPPARSIRTRCGQAGNRADDERVLRELLQCRTSAVAGERPHGGDVADRHAKCDHQRHPRQSLRAAEPLREARSDVRVEAVGHLCPRGVPACVDAGQRPRASARAMPTKSIASAAIARFAAWAGCSGLFTDRVEEQDRKSRQTGAARPRPRPAVEAVRRQMTQPIRMSRKSGSRRSGFATAASVPARAAPARWRERR